MGQPAIKMDAVKAPRGAEVVQLNADVRSRAGGADGASAPHSQLPALLEMVSRAATVMGQRRDIAHLMEGRATSAEAGLTQLKDRLAEAEAKLQVALEEADRERTRADDLGRRSTELIAKTQSMLAEANDRRAAAEWRAEQAEESFSTLRAAVERGFAETA